MKKMKRLITVVLAMLLAVTVMACAEQEATYVLEQNGTTITVVYTAKGDIVQKQSTHTEMPYTAVGITTAAEAEAMFEPFAATYQGIEGLTHSIEYKDDMVVENLEIDYQKVNLEDVKELMGMSFDDNAKNGAKISLKRSGEMLETQGYVKK